MPPTVTFLEDAARAADNATRTPRPRLFRSTRSPRKRARRWLVVVARDEDAIHSQLRRLFANDRQVRVIFDRRADSSRNHPSVARSLSIHGFAVVVATGERPDVGGLAAG